MLTFRRCSVKEQGCYVVKAINNIGSDTKNWKMLVVATEPNTLLDSCKALPGGNQFLCEKRKNVQSANNTATKLVEVNHALVLYLFTYTIFGISIFYHSLLKMNSVFLNKIWLSTKEP